MSRARRYVTAGGVAAAVVGLFWLAHQAGGGLSALLAASVVGITVVALIWDEPGGLDDPEDDP